MSAVTLPTDVSDEILKEFPEYPRQIVQLLFNRGITTQEAVENFLYPEYHHNHDPYLFRDMRKACERIYQAIKQNELIAIHGDYDADGVSGAVILESTLSMLHARTMVFLPHREKDGYGVNKKNIDYIHGQGAKLIITCDCGISNGDEVMYASTLGLDVIITDHHQIPAVLPPALAIIHPGRDGETYPFKFLAGGGVAYKLVQGLIRHEAFSLDEHKREMHEKWLLDLVAISSVADMVSLVGENRILVKYGLKVLAKNKRLGLQELMTVAGIDPQNISTHTIGYQIAPRINAAGRMDHANTAFMLLNATDQPTAHHLATLLEKQNKDRQTKTDVMYKQALAQADRETSKAMVFFDESWTAGLTGLLAGKLSKKFNKPVFAMGYDGSRIVGSGRAPDAINIMDGVLATKDHLLSFGGHPQACGFRFDTLNKDSVIRNLKDYFDEHIADGLLTPRVVADCSISFKKITWELAEYLRQFEPFGQGNQEPLFYATKIGIRSSRPVGKQLNHMKMVVEQGNVTFGAIAFDVTTDLLPKDGLCSIIFSIAVNEWNGSKELQLVIKSIINETSK